MRHIITLLILHCLCLLAVGQEFNIETELISNSTEYKSHKNFVKCDSAFFQDEHYYVRKTCSGEWGGSVWFKNKETGIEYSCSATCPVVINKVQDNYVLTNSLAHGIGSAEVIEIENPDCMEKFRLPKTKKKKRKLESRYIGYDESKSRLGLKVLVDTIGAMILMTFPYEGQLFHIVSKSQSLYLCQIEKGRLVTRDTIYKNLDSFYKRDSGILYSYNTYGFKAESNHYIVLFENSGLVGYLDIYENKIRYQ